MQQIKLWMRRFIALEKAKNDYLKFYCSYLKNGSPFTPCI